MSAVADTVTVLSPATGRHRQAPASAAAPSRPAVRLIAFCALGLYGAQRWAGLMTPTPIWRLVGLLGLAALVAGGLGVLARRGLAGRAIAVLGALAIVFVSLLLAGVPVPLLVHLRLHTIAAGISQGLGALPRVTVPYGGIDEWARTVVLLGAAVLMLDAGVLLAFAPPALGDARRAAAALPLIALAVVPLTLMPPSRPYLHGLLLLGLVAALVWGERLRRRALAAAVSVTAAAGGLALVVAPSIANHSPWIDYQSLAGAFSPSHVERFDWTQHYGPLLWPRNGREMLDVQASRPDYWKAEDLDTFNGIGWVPGAVETGNLLPAPDPNALARWTQTLRVTIRGMQTTDVVAAGFASAPLHTPEPVLTGDSPGTWAATVDLGPGDTYLVDTYSPRPSEAQLAAATATSPELSNLVSGYRSVVLPAPPSTPYAQPEILFPPFHSSAPAESIAPLLGYNGAAFVSSSPYQGAYALASRLARRAATPLAFVDSVERYLARGFTYSENPPRRRYPLESFLFQDKVGYCQQFSGAMALLLRMGGVPSRVAAGFTPGTYDPASHQWIVTDLNAHSWVEVWFPRYGWVRFDPTPAAAPALGGQNAVAALAAGARRGGVVAQPKRRPETATAARSHGSSPAAGASVSIPIVAGLVLACALVVLLLVLARRGRRPPAEELVEELERALARCGRPLQTGTTLAQLEQRLRSSPEAADYVHTLLLARYASARRTPTLAQRRALRARLADGLGAPGRMRALWALPPRF